MKKSTKSVPNVKGNLKITTFFITQEKLNSKKIADSKINNEQNDSSNSKAIIGNGKEKPLSNKRKVNGDADICGPPQKKSNVFEWELPDNDRSKSELKTNKCDENISLDISPPRLAHSGESSSDSIISVKSPEQLLSPDALKEYYTPEKKLERFLDKIKTSSPRKKLFEEDSEPADKFSTFFSKIETMQKQHQPTTPKNVIKTENNISKSGEKSPQKTPNKMKRTPKKLFHKSPSNLDKFNVQILNNFVKITPSKSMKIDSDVEFIKSAEKKQVSIQKYFSPSPSPRSVEAQNRNESTPTKDITVNHHNGFLTPSSKVRTKLNFSSCTAEKPSSSGIQMSKSKSPKKVKSPKFNDNPKTDLQMESSNSSKQCDISAKENDFNVTNLDCSFGDEWLEELLIPTQLDYKLDLTESQHCKIVSINAYPTKNVITLKSTKNGEQALCNLEGFWMHSQLSIGDTVHIAAKKLNEIEWIVNNDHGLLVYEPDLLISATSVVNTLWCKRKSVLSDCFRGFEPTNEAMLVGSLVHNLLQHILKNKIYDQEQIEKVAMDLVKNRNVISGIYDCGVTIESIKEQLLKYIPKILSFIHLYVKDVKPKNQHNIKYNKEDWKGTIMTIDDIEENIWCPELGIKGKVDVSIKTDVNNLMPLELKTGRASVSLEHRGQVLMYIMMMNKLGFKVPSGLLLYLREGVLREVPTTQKEERDIIIMRNELAYYLTRKPKITDDEQTVRKKLLPPELPEPINHRSCANCPYSVICTAYAKYNNEDISSMKTLQSIQDNVLQHLDQEHLNYFMHWVSLIALESNSNKRSKNLREIYTLPPEERENNGKCIINLKVTNIGKECSGVVEHTFKKLSSEPGINFFSYGIMESNYVIVSIANRPAIAAGFVTDITMNHITVTLDRNLSKKYRDQTFYIDTYDSSSIQTYNLTSLTMLMELSDRGEKLRKIIVDKMPPTFKTRLPKFLAAKGKGILRRLNMVQQRAVLKAFAANDYFLIKGMPGTGKTATIVALIQLLVATGKTVLITSHTHSAVDNVCIRLTGYEGIKLLRLGSESRIHPSLKKYSEYHLTKNCTLPEELEAVYNSAEVLAVTCLGSGHPILSKRVMDVCIVDESTQVVQSSVIRPLHSAKTFILIGDPDQLPAVVQSQEAIELGMSESLFERLYSEEAAVALNLNYRMNTTITALANHFTYGGELKIGNKTVANATLNLPKKELLYSTCQDSQWLMKVLDDSMENAVQFVDTGPVWKFKHNVPWCSYKSNANEENSEIQSCVNIYEGAIVFHLVKALLKAGVESNNIGVITTFRAQVAQISHLLQTDGVDVSTVDQFQGKDKNVIIYSSAKSKDFSVSKSNSKFEILEDKRRLTVAITRAKHKLIVVGDVSTLQQYSTFQKILPYAEANLIRLSETANFSWDDVLGRVKVL